MKYRKIVIERIIFEESTIEDRNIFYDDGYEIVGDTNCYEPICEKVIKQESITVNS